MNVRLVLWPPLSLRRKDAILDLPKRTSAVSKVGFGGPLGPGDFCLGVISVTGLAVEGFGVNLASGRSAGGNPFGGAVVAA